MLGDKNLLVYRGFGEKRPKGEGEVDPVDHIHQAVGGFALHNHVSHVDALGDDEVTQGGILARLPGDDQVVNLHNLPCLQQF